MHPRRSLGEVLERTRSLWELQDRHGGDRHRLYRAVAGAVTAQQVLYPGSFVDLAPSFVWPSVTYVDVDRRARQFFADAAGVDELLVANGTSPAARSVRFVAGDYSDPLALDAESVDLLISLYAGFVSEHCTTYLRRGGHLLVGPSHGDAAMASLDPRYRLSAVVRSAARGYSVNRRDLDTYLVPRRHVEVTRSGLHATGRGIAYTRSPFAYLFQRVA